MFHVTALRPGRAFKWGRDLVPCSSGGAGQLRSARASRCSAYCSSVRAMRLGVFDESGTRRGNYGLIMDESQSREGMPPIMEQETSRVVPIGAGVGDARLRDMEIEAHYLTPPHRCSYLPGQTAMLEYVDCRAISTEEYGRMLEQGWRRF